MTLLKDFKAAGGGEWQGEIYPRKCQDLFLQDVAQHAGSIDRPPYVGLPLFGKTLTWTRVASGREPN